MGQERKIILQKQLRNSVSYTATHVQEFTGRDDMISG